MTVRFSTTSLLTILVLALAGCRAITGSCHDPAPYTRAQSAAPLQIPVGLEAPNTRGALSIPELKTPPPPPRKEGDACLDTPPSYKAPAGPPQA